MLFRNSWELDQACLSEMLPPDDESIQIKIRYSCKTSVTLKHVLWAGEYELMKNRRKSEQNETSCMC